MIPRTVSSALSLFYSIDDPRKAPIQTYLKNHWSKLTDEPGSWDQSVACKPFVGSYDDISSWIEHSVNPEALDTWTTLGGPIVAEVLRALSESRDAPCRAGVVKVFINILITASEYEQRAEIETLRSRMSDIFNTFPDLCSVFRNEFTAIYGTFPHYERRSRRFQSNHAILTWTLCPDELLAPTIAITGPFQVVKALYELSHHFPYSDIGQHWAMFKFQQLISHLTSSGASYNALRELLKMVISLYNKVPSLPGVSRVCQVGPTVLRNVFSEDVLNINISRLCANDFTGGSFCGQFGPSPNEWIPDDPWDRSKINIPILVEVIQLSEPSCGSKIKEAVWTAILGGLAGTDFEKSREISERQFPNYQALCPLWTVPHSYRTQGWMLFHVCHYREDIVCPIANSWTMDLAEPYIEGLLNIFSNSFEHILKESQLIRIINSLSCKRGLLLLLNILLERLSNFGDELSSIVILKGSLSPDLQSNIQTICAITESRSMLYVQGFCDEGFIPNITSNPVHFTKFWKWGGFQSDVLCSFAAHANDVGLHPHLFSPGESVPQVLKNEFAFEQVLSQQAKQACGRGPLIGNYILRLLNTALLTHWSNMNPSQDWAELESMFRSFCTSEDTIELLLPQSESVDAMFLPLVCPTWPLTFTQLHEMKGSLHVDIPSLCGLLNASMRKRDSNMYRFCFDNCSALIEPPLSSSNKLRGVDWISHWAKCGSPVDAIPTYIQEHAGRAWEAEIDQAIDAMASIDHFNQYSTDVLSKWPQNLPPAALVWIESVARSLSTGFAKFKSLSHLTIDLIQSFCQKEQAVLSLLHGRGLGNLFLVCDNVELTWGDLFEAIRGVDVESFCSHFNPTTPERTELRDKFCVMGCHRLMTETHHLDAWIPLWRMCGSPRDAVFSIEGETTSVEVSDFSQFIKTALINWEPIPVGSVLVSMVAQILSNGLKSGRVLDSERSVIREFCHKENNSLRSSTLSNDKRSTLFLVAECDNLPISYDSMKYFSEETDIGWASVCKLFEKDPRQESIAEYCANSDCHELDSITDPIEWTRIWKTCKTPSDTVCRLFERISKAYRSISVGVEQVFRSRFFDLDSLKTTFALFDFVNAIDKVPQCASLGVGYIGAVLGVGLQRLSENGLNLIEIDFLDFSNLCNHHSEELGPLIGSIPQLTFVCPTIPVSFETLSLIIDPAIPGPRDDWVIANLVVARETAFSDWINADEGDEEFIPRRVNWKNEPGQDVGGIARDWITTVADIVASPVKCDAAGGLFELDDNTKQFLIFSQSKTGRSSSEGGLFTHVRSEYFNFGRFLAIVLMRREQIGIPLPVFFFAKLLYGIIRPVDLQTIDRDKANSYSNLIRDVEKSNESLKFYFDELSDEPFTLTNLNVKEVISKVLDAEYMPGSANEAMDAIRDGLSAVIAIQKIRNRLTPELFRYYVVGDETLDGDKLKILARRDGERFAAPLLSDRVFDMLFDWLKVNPQLHRQFMIFTTGSSSLRPRELLITGPDSTRQGLVPKAHTCFNWLVLPEYRDYDELDRMLSEAIFHTRMGMN